MSYRSKKFLNYKGTRVPDQIHQTDKMPEQDLKNIFKELMDSGVHGFCFSLYEEGQQPGEVISEDQIRRRLKILKQHTNWVRTFSCSDGHELIPEIAKQLGMKTLVGAWLGEDIEKNNEEIDSLIQLIQKGLVDVAAVGNEVLYRKELSEEQLLDYISQVKSKSSDVPVGYVDAYYEFVDHPRVSDMCDVILCNCYPYWEGTPFEFSFDHMRHMFQVAVEAGNGKRVIITETGWPAKGETLGGAVPSEKNALKYFINFHLWAKENKIETFYFSSFDEAWKVSAEGEVGAYWGIWNSKERLKFLD